MSEKTKQYCFGDNLGSQTSVFGRIYFLNNKEVNINLRIYNPKKQIMDTRTNRQEITFAFVTEEPGSYQYCLQKLDSKKSVTVQFVYNSGIGSNDMIDILSKSDMKPVDTFIPKIKKMLIQLKNELNFVQKQGEVDQVNIEGIYSSILLFGFITIVILIFMAIFQISYFKAYFKSKKEK
eukprot:TRINITY_DN3106_c0_g1_i1.p2 TRINITY_DN3106_c0_g1~~TRINITY_DN3106_c0_g1_i1.p2  ORF type:complete len:179 (+),score=33.62 TRINITY_DN3106_c0_g1_i1:196-732(+)